MSQAGGRMSPWLIIRESKIARLSYLALLKKLQYGPQKKEPSWRQVRAGRVEVIATSLERIFAGLVGRRES